MFSWSNEKNLSELQASGVDNVLEFRSKNERAVVRLSANGSGIDEVFYKSDDREFTVNRGEAYHLVLGETDNTKRDVFHYLERGGLSKMMRLGITHHHGCGTWSSLPHDFELRVEEGFEEVFFYICPGDSAIQIVRGVWHDGTPADEVFRVRDKTFATIPMGYHPIVAEPNSTLSYIWCYLAKYPRWEKINERRRESTWL